MDNFDLSKLTSDQERVLGDAYNFIKHRAAWLRTKKKSATENADANTSASTAGDITNSALAHQKDDKCDITIKKSS